MRLGGVAIGWTDPLTTAKTALETERQEDSSGPERPPQGVDVLLYTLGERAASGNGQKVLHSRHDRSRRARGVRTP